MLIKCYTVMFLVLLLTVCLFVYRQIADTSAVHGDLFLKKYTDIDSNPIVMSDKLNNIFWFVQLSDLHFSVHADPARITDLKRFCEEHLKILSPDVVIVSGDITDAKYKHNLRSRQYKEEWSAYSSILANDIVAKVHWLDIPGNHDTFHVSKSSGPLNIYKTFGARGQSRSSYHFSLQKPFGQYSFIALDATHNRGVGFPLNFFGSITDENALALQNFSNQAQSSNHTFWFGHYPTSTIISPAVNIRSLLGDSAFTYLCGHLHTLHNLLPRMYAVQPEGFLELELGDWRDNRYFRIVAVDHDLVSFKDYQLLPESDKSTEWPIVILTNPKQANFLLPHKEPFRRMETSTHIRLLAWSKWPIMEVMVEVDGEFLGKAVPGVASTTNVTDLSHSNHLYVLPWNPKKWKDDNFHTIRIHVEDSNGNSRTIQQPFVISETGVQSWRNGIFASIVLASDLSLTIRTLFYSFWSLVVILFMLPKLIPAGIWFSISCNTRISRGLFVLTRRNGIFMPILIVLIYEVCGPTFFGFIMGDHVGAVFSFGIFVSGSFFMDTLTFFYEFCQLFSFTLFVLVPLTFQAGSRRYFLHGTNVSSSKYELTSINEPASSPTHAHARNVTGRRATKSILSIPLDLFFIPFFFSCLQIIFLSLSIGIPYGILAFLLSPGRSIPIIAAWYMSLKLAHSSATRDVST